MIYDSKEERSQDDVYSDGIIFCHIRPLSGACAVSNLSKDGERRD